MPHITPATATVTKEKDVLIIGGGIAGTMLGWHLLRRGVSFDILDEGYKEASSYRAAGLINPVTGRRFVKSWMFDTLQSYFSKVYDEIGEYLGREVIREVRFIRRFASPLEENIWLSKCNQPGYTPYISVDSHLSVEGSVYTTGMLTGVTKGWRILSPGLLDGLHDGWTREGRIIQGRWMQPLDSDDSIVYGSTRYDKLVFATGSAFPVMEEWQSLPLIPNGGEYLILKIPALDTRFLLKHKEVLVPLGEHHYWFGATYDWDGVVQAPSTEGLEYLTQALEQLITCPYEIVEHQIGIRPTVKDRRPLLGTSIRHPNVHLFTGFGTKGFSLAPFWARHFVQHLLDNTPLDPAVNIDRF